MILYHGSNLTVAEPKLVEQNRYLDLLLRIGSIILTIFSEIKLSVEPVSQRALTAIMLPSPPTATYDSKALPGSIKWDTIKLMQYSLNCTA